MSDEGAEDGPGGAGAGPSGAEPGGAAAPPGMPAGLGAAIVVLALLAVVAVLGEQDGSALGGGSEPAPASKAALSVYDGRSPSEPGDGSLRVLVELPRPPLAERDDLDEMGAAQQRAYVRSLEREGESLRSALGARGVELRDAVAYGRTWDGFAATVAASDLASLSSLGVRALPVRRFYPATSEPVPAGGKTPAAPAGTDRIAILDTGAGAPGYDALDRDDEPTPGADPRSARRETSGAALAEVVAAAGEPTFTIRVAGYGANRQEVHGTTDTLIAGLERAVDPDGDGAVDDAARVALVGVNAPYAGFGDSPEAEAVRGAGKIGTLVVAPAGNEGPARPPNGVIGSPAAARTALAVGATEVGAGVPRVDVTVGEQELAGAAVLAGAPDAGGELAGPVTSVDAAELLRGGSLSGRVALVRAGDNPTAQAAAAAGAGATAVLLADPRDRPLPMLPAGRAAAPVVGVTGEAAKAALEAKAGAKVSFGNLTVAAAWKGGGGAGGGGAAGGGAGPAPFSSRGPAFDGSPKPDALAEGAAVTSQGLVTGTAVAAARVAVRAARLSRRRPSDTPAGLREALASPSAEEAGAPPAPPVPLGPLRLTRSGKDVVGVRFALGAFERGDPLAGGTTIEPASRLQLELVDADDQVRQTLTPPGGARDLLPAEYAYRLTEKALKQLEPGAYRFRATARAPRRDAPRTRRSPGFEIR